MSNEYRVVNLTLKLYVPSNYSEDDVVEYFNDKLYNDPDYFGEVDNGCVELTEETFEV